MKLIARVKLQPAPEQHAALLKTLEAANAACNYVSDKAWQDKVFGQFALHKLCYADVRTRFGLGADVAVRVFAKVADGYKLDKRIQRTFKPRGAFPFNDRLVSYKLDKRIVSIWTMAGRQKMPFVVSTHAAKLLEGLRGECDLVYRKGEFYLYQCCDVDEPPTDDVDDFLGVDLGIANIATDSDRTVHQGKAMKAVRFRHRKLRTQLQRKGTKSARRCLKKLAGKEQRFAKDVNHTISKRIVAKAKDTARGIALEELTHIRKRVTARKPQRATLSSWSFAQLRVFIEYKAKQRGVPVVAVDPRNTSRTCPCCGHIDKANRPNQSAFSCVECGYSAHADWVAAINIGRRASLSKPHVSDTDIDFCR
ncbi:MAG: transposase [Caldilineaceae bacterium]|nr:transposase [Caldilineaceae bacterium]